MPKRDMVMKDGDTLKIGDQDIRFISTPGHTPGVLSAYNITLRDGSNTYKAFWGGGGGGGEGLKGAEHRRGQHQEDHGYPGHPGESADA